MSYFQNVMNQWQQSPYSQALQSALMPQAQGVQAPQPGVGANPQQMGALQQLFNQYRQQVQAPYQQAPPQYGGLGGALAQQPQQQQAPVQAPRPQASNFDAIRSLWER